MNSGLIAIALIVGVLLLGVGLIVTTLPLFSDISISLPWLFFGGVCLVAGALSLWHVRKLAISSGSGEAESGRPFFAVLGIFNLLIFASNLSAHAEKWRSFIWGMAALGIVLCVAVIARRPNR
jgi:hypothetical protein